MQSEYTVISAVLTIVPSAGDGKETALTWNIAGPKTGEGPGCDRAFGNALRDIVAVDAKLVAKLPAFVGSGRTFGSCANTIRQRIFVRSTVHTWLGGRSHVLRKV